MQGSLTPLTHSLLRTENPGLFELSLLDASYLIARLSLCKMEASPAGGGKILKGTENADTKSQVSMCVTR